MCETRSRLNPRPPSHGTRSLAMRQWVAIAAVGRMPSSVAIIVCLLLSACGTDRPATETAKAALQGNITGPLAGQLRLADFQKTDGQAKEVMGVKVYELEFRATIEFLDDVMYQSSENAIQTSAPGPTLNRGGFSWDAWFNTAVA